jgi:hypothetical protein
MVNESVTSTGFELASFGEVLYAFSALRSTSGRRRGGRATSELLPWETMPGNAIECEGTAVLSKPPVHVPARVEPVAETRVVKSRRAAGRCHCGECRNCQENARWERIFQEKFANSDYYHHDIRIRYASPLSSV